MVKKFFAKFYVYFVLFLMYVPILVLVVFSFTVGENIGEWNGFSLDLFGRLFRNDTIMKAVGNTLIIALISALCSTILGTLGAVGTYYSKKRNKAIIENLNQIPVVNAEIVIALSLTFTFVFIGSYIFKGEVFGFWTLLVGHMVLETPFVYLNVKPKLIQMDQSLYEAALDLGCSPREAINKAIIPQIAPGIVSGFMLAFTLSLDDFIVTAFTTGPGLLNGNGKIETISTYIQSVIKKKTVPIETRALVTLILLAVIIATIAVSLYQRQTNPKYKVKYKTKEEKFKRNLKYTIIYIILLAIVLTIVIFGLIEGMKGGN